MKKNLRAFILIFGSTVIFNSYCQDVLFSFSEYSNMNLNPELSGSNFPLEPNLNIDKLLLRNEISFERSTTFFASSLF